MTTTSEERPEPATSTLAFFVVVIGVLCYLAAGIAYASSASRDVVGMTNGAHVVGIGMQILGWPLFLLTQG